MKKWYFLFVFPLNVAWGQILTVDPEFPVTNDTVTIIYNAQEGNGALAGYTGDVFAHTGVLTTESQNGNDWKHVVDDWGTFDSTTLMESLGNDLYRIKYHIKSFYGINDGEQVTSLAFVFRNVNGSIVGRSEDNSDIYYAINLQVMGDYQSYSLSGSSLTVQTETGTITLRPFTSNMIQVALQPPAEANPDSSFSVVMEPNYSGAIVQEFSDHLEFSTDSITVLITKFPVRLTYLFSGDTLLKEESGIYQNYQGGGFRSYLNETEHLYGTGSRAIDVDRRGKKFSSYNSANYGYSFGASTLNINIPLVISTNGYALYMDNYSPGNWDFGNSISDVLNYTFESGAFSYFFISGSSNEEILNQYTQLTGRQPLPPRWALGYIQSKYGYQNETEARSIVSQMQSKNFPMDALVLDLYWFGSPSTMGNLDWDYSKWQQPVDMMHDFDSLGIKTILITEPYITLNSSNYSTANSNGYLATDVNGNEFVIGNFWAGSAGLLDMFSAESQNWMWNFYDGRITEGAGGWWCDLGEPENHPSGLYHSIGSARTVHNVYSLIWAEMLFEKYKQYHPQERLFNLTRSGYAGMQRYSVFPWSGDIQRSFDGLKAQIPIMLGMSMSGVGYMHSDIGGFTGGGQNEELYTRWQELGAFAPVERAHGEGVPTEPVYYSTTCQNTVRKYVSLRYQLTPYNYSLAYQNATRGTPLARPLNFYEPWNEALSNINDQFLWGENMMVAPVTTSGVTSRSVIFPSGKWINYWNNTQEYEGGTTATVSAALDVLPLFIKAGSFIPMVPPLKTLSAYNTDTLIVKYYPELSVPQSSCFIYDDDGKDAEALANAGYDLISLAGTVDWHLITVNLSKSGNSFAGAPQMREMNFQFQRLLDAPTNVLLNGTDLPFKSTLDEFGAADSAVYFDASADILYVHFKWNGEAAVLQLLNTMLSGMGELQSSSLNDLKIFPNPATHAATVWFNMKSGGTGTVEITSASGQLMRTAHFKMQEGENELSLDLSALPQGIYFITVNGIHQSLRGKLVKQ